MNRSPRVPLVLLAVAVLAPLGPRAARGDGLTGLAEPSMSADRSVTTGEGVTRVQVESLQLLQRYRLDVDRSVYPRLRLGANATYDQRDVVEQTEGLPDQRTEDHTWGLGLRADLGGDAITGGAMYELRGLGGESRLGNGPAQAFPGVYREAANANAAWRPADLPALDLRWVRAHVWDDVPGGVDRTDQLVALQAAFSPLTTLDLRYRANYSWTDNPVTGVQDRSLGQTLRGSWGEAFLDRRLSLFASADAAHGWRQTEATRADAFRETQQTLAAGLSGLERFPATPERIVLEPNAALADGVVTAAAGIDLGYARSEANDTDRRDMGGRFVDDTTPVTELRVWVDRRLPLEVTSAFAWEVYRSADNESWTPVALGGAVTFSPVETRFEIPIVRTSARYLKVVTRPLAVGVTSDPAYAQILVTELQAFLVEPVGLGTETSTRSRVAASASSKLVLARSWNVTWDAFVDVAKASDRDFVQWILSNGLSFTRRVAEPVVLSGRAERSDTESGSGVETSHRASLASTWEPLPTFGGNAALSASRVDASSGDREDVSGQLGVRADLYSGVSLNAQGDLTYARATGDVHTRRVGGTGNASLTPHRTLGLSGSFTYSSSVRVAPGLEDLVDTRARLDGSVSWTPVPTVNVSATVGRELYFRVGNFYSAAVTASPLRDGTLQLTITGASALDTLTDSTTLRWGPSLRWRFVHRGYLDLAYTGASYRSSTGKTDSQTVFAKLIINLG